MDDETFRMMIRIQEMLRDVLGILMVGAATGGAWVVYYGVQKQYGET